MRTRRTRVAIVGTGDIAATHASALAELSARAEMVAAVDIVAERASAFAAANGIPRSYTDLDLMLAAEQPDVVHLCTPPGLHADQAVRSLHAGAWVLCEKPACLSLAEHDLITAAEQLSGNRFAVVFQHRFGSAGKHVRHLLGTGALGRPLLAVCLTMWYRDEAYYAVPWRGRWATEGGGPSMTHGIHQIDLLAHLLGEWSEVRAMVTRLDRPVETEDVSLAQVQFATGAVASVVNSVLSPREESYIRLDLTDATVELKHLYGYGDADWTITPAPHVAADRISGWGFTEPEVPSSHHAQLAEFLDAFDQRQPPSTSGAEGRRALELITALYASAFTGKPLLRMDLTPALPFYHSLRGGVPNWAPRTVEATTPVVPSERGAPL